MTNFTGIVENTLMLSLVQDDLTEKRLNQLGERILHNDNIAKVGFDLGAVEVLGNVFFDCLMKMASAKKVAVYNLDAQNLLLFYLMKYHQFVSLFMNEHDFLHDRNVLVKRFFAVCK